MSEYFATQKGLSVMLLKSLEEFRLSKGAHYWPSCGELVELRLLDDIIHKGLSIVRTFQNAALPINRVPPEILASIFELTLFDYRRGRMLTSSSIPCTDDETGGWEPDSYHYQFTLAQVCRHFRAVALAQPMLWSTIVFHSGCRGKSFYDALFHRSQQVPLNILVYSFPVEWSQEDITLIRDCIKGNAHRIRSLVLERLPVIFGGDNEIFNFGDHDMPLLESVVYPAIDYVDEDGTEHRDGFGIERILPRLLYLKTVGILQGSRVDWPARKNFRHLTSLIFYNDHGLLDGNLRSNPPETLTVLTVERFISLLRDNPQLCVLKLGGIEISTESNELLSEHEVQRRFPRVTLKQLRHLDIISCNTTTVVHTVLQHCEFSVLHPTEITIHSSIGGQPGNYYFSNIIDDILPCCIFEYIQIRKLHIQEGFIGDDEFGNLYRYPIYEPKETVTTTFFTSYSLSISICLAYDLDLGYRSSYVDKAKNLFGIYDPDEFLTEIHFESSIHCCDNPNSMYSFLSYLELNHLSALTIRQSDFDQLQWPDNVQFYGLPFLLLEQLIFVCPADEDIQSIPVENRLLGSGTMVIPGVKSIRVVEPADAPVFKPFD
ncbi:hypothetical protein C8Q75DRAFT_737969 [Abortiporus biennis]|nr:hypothetical protein C8Q75DRAFT_737969 [Abortiporus biennis]